MTQAEQDAIFLDLKNDFPLYAEKCLKIRQKGAAEGDAGTLVPFILNRAQKYIWAIVKRQWEQKGYVRVIIVKGRQQGCTTEIQGLGYWFTSHRFGVRTFILTHEEEATNNLFDMAKRFHENCPPELQPSTRAANAKEMSFGILDSGYKIGTAGNKSVGRSSTIQFLHASEAAFYKHAEEHAKGILQTVPDAKDTFVFLESTANGVGNWFHQQWQMAESGLSDFIPIFVPWYWQDEYRRALPEDFSLTEEEKQFKIDYLIDDEQICWRRNKIIQLSANGQSGERAFKQEYPFFPAEAFQEADENSFIGADLVNRARQNFKQKVVEPYGPLLIGVDPAGLGADRTVIIRRRGRYAFGMEVYKKKDGMEIVGIINNIIQTENPARVFIDSCGLGGPILDRIRELGYGPKIVTGVNSAETKTLLHPSLYKNKRAEIWGIGKRWFEDEIVAIPDSDELHGDLIGPRGKVASNGTILIESKDEMKTRGIRSSDCADALLLTFAFPVTAEMAGLGKNKSIKEAGKRITAGARSAAQYRRGM